MTKNQITHKDRRNRSKVQPETGITFHNNLIPTIFQEHKPKFNQIILDNS